MSDQEEVSDSEYEEYSESDHSMDAETAGEKRIRLAKEYLDTVTKDLGNELEVDAKELDKELIASRLRKDTLESQGKLFRKVADEYDFESVKVTASLKGHQLPATAVLISPNGKWLFSSSKDGSIIQWDLESKKILWKLEKAKKTSKMENRHSDQVCCLAISSDNQFLASGGKDKLIHIWSIKDRSHLKAFKHHKDAVTGLVFRKGANQLYSCSLDRTLAVWNIENLSYVESLYGHQDSVSSVDSLSRERCVSIGQRDRTARLWKIMEESQLIFNQTEASGGCFDTIKLIDEDNFVTGSDSGTITLWNANKKKPVYSISDVDKQAIQSIETLAYTDLFATGSKGIIKFWKCADNLKSFHEIARIEIPGYINSMSFSSVGDVLVVGAGREPRLGRWDVDKSVPNRIYILKLK